MQMKIKILNLVTLGRKVQEFSHEFFKLYFIYS